MDMQIVRIFTIYLEGNMKYRITSLITEPLHQKLLTIVFEKSNYFSVCTFKRYHKKDLSDTYFDFLRELRRYEKDAFEFCLPHHYEKGQTFHVYELNEETKRRIKSVGSFSGWSAPNYPEDLSFYEDKKVWLSSVSHENLIFIETTESGLVDKFTKLGLRLVEQ